MNDELREAVARWLFERQEVMRSLASPEDADWDEWVERNREEWREVADAVLALPEIAALRAKADAADRVRELCAEALERAYASDADVLVSDVLEALDGDQP